ncbi:MAG: DNA-3-methyladenine glycosylase I [Actinobacteria bacterium]|nr:DNA-3-methyladenine glycosylase I [Actinomycetota bacterium]
MTIQSDALVTGPDGVTRCAWAAATALEQHYHDTEWGRAVVGEHDLFERIVLEAFQAGLSWRLVLERRDALRAAFHGFDVDRVAAMTDEELAERMTDPSIIRNRAKIFATRSNARATVALREDPCGDLHELIWSFQPAEHTPPTNLSEYVATTPESVAMAKALKNRGFTFVGPVTAYAMMQAVGLVDDHVVGCHRSAAR